MSQPTTCPSCGNQVPQLVSVDAGLRITLQESGDTSIPDQVCMNCYGQLRKQGSHGSKIRAEQKAKEENRMMMWAGRVNLVKQARAMMKAKAYSEAAVAYEKYIRTLEIVFEVKAGELQPEHFKAKARQAEMTVVASVYWDLVCIYDTSNRYGNRMDRAAGKLAEFARFTPIYSSILKKAQVFQTKAKNPRIIKRFLKNANAERPRCFIATAVFIDPHTPELLVLCRFRDQILQHSKSGRAFVYAYYKVSPKIAWLIDRSPILRQALRPFLKKLSNAVASYFRLEHNP